MSENIKLTARSSLAFLLVEKFSQRVIRVITFFNNGHIVSKLFTTEKGRNKNLSFSLCKFIE